MASAQVRAEAAERRSRALQLRLAGMQFEQIGKQLTSEDSPNGVTKERAYQLYRAALKEIVREPNEELVKAEIERLDLLYRAMVTKALAGSARHAEVAFHILESKRRLLGLDAPTKSETKLDVRVHEGIDAEIEQLMERMRERDPAPS